MSTTSLLPPQSYQYHPPSPAHSIISAASSASSYWSNESVSSTVTSVASVTSTTHNAFSSVPPTTIIPQLSSNHIQAPVVYNREDRCNQDGSRRQFQPAHPPAITTPVPIEQRQHPRRSNRLIVESSGICAEAAQSAALAVAPPPPLQRQADRKVNFVENLVDSAAQIVETIWPPPKPISPKPERVLPLRVFIQETLRRSRTSYSTLQVALYYLIVIKPHLPGMDCDTDGLEPEELQLIRAKQCGRRMFLAALILASKYLQDRNYSARAWSKISGLQTQEINVNEKAFLAAIDWRLHISEVVFQKWTDLVLKYTSAPSASPVSPTRDTHLTDEEIRRKEWCDLIAQLSPDLREVQFPEQHDMLNNEPSSAQVDLTPAALKRSTAPAPLQLNRTHSDPLPPRSIEPQIQSTSAFNALQHSTFTTVEPTPRPAIACIAQSPASSLSSCFQEKRPPFRPRLTEPASITRRSSTLSVCTPASPVPNRLRYTPRMDSIHLIVKPSPRLTSLPSPRALATIMNTTTPISSPRMQDAARTLNMLRGDAGNSTGQSTGNTPVTRKRSFPSMVSGNVSAGSTGVTPRMRGLGGFGSPIMACGSPVGERGGNKRVRCGLGEFEGGSFEGGVAQGVR